MHVAGLGSINVRGQCQEADLYNWVIKASEQHMLPFEAGGIYGAPSILTFPKRDGVEQERKQKICLRNRRSLYHQGLYGEKSFSSFICAGIKAPREMNTLEFTSSFEY